MNARKIYILTSNGEISHKIIFAETPQDADDESYYTNARIHPDDSIRTIKMKLLYGITIWNS